MDTRVTVWFMQLEEKSAIMCVGSLGNLLPSDGEWGYSEPHRLQMGGKEFESRSEIVFK